MSVLSLSVALQIAASCAPSVSPDTWLSIIHNESKFDTWAIGDNTARQSYHPISLPDAVALASKLAATGHSIDIGVAQLNVAAGHLQRRGLPISAAFDPCTAFRVGSGVLAECWARATGADVQARLMAAIGCYNAGHPLPGTAYVQRVQASASRIVPAIRLVGSNQEPTTPEDVRAPEPRRTPLGLEDALHASPASSDADDDIADALHHPTAPKEDQ